MRPLISRKYAIAAKLTKYYTGVPCINGHDTIRYVAAGCYGCIIARRPRKSVSPVPTGFLLVPGYKWTFVSRDGQVWSSRKGRLLKPCPTKAGHLYVGVADGVTNARAVHVLVALAFIPNPLSLPEVNHKDLNKSNNSVENLEWCTRQYNMDHLVANRKHN